MSRAHPPYICTLSSHYSPLAQLQGPVFPERTALPHHDHAVSYLHDRDTLLCSLSRAVGVSIPGAVGVPLPCTVSVPLARSISAFRYLVDASAQRIDAPLHRAEAVLG